MSRQDAFQHRQGAERSQSQKSVQNGWGDIFICGAPSPFSSSDICHTVEKRRSEERRIMLAPPGFYLLGRTGTSATWTSCWIRLVHPSM
ncbi:uncharacterized protein V6R79_018168 [Siganus canaliculatus]